MGPNCIGFCGPQQRVSSSSHKEDTESQRGEMASSGSSIKIRWQDSQELPPDLPSKAHFAITRAPSLSWPLLPLHSTAEGGLDEEPNGNP